jgi:DNA modification methylase
MYNKTMTNENKIKILQNVPITEIKPYEKNYQKHDANLEHIKNSIKDFDFDVPIVVDVNNVIVKGHGRYEALKELGKDTIPLVAINMALDTKKKASAARIADNESSKAAVVDSDILKFELDLIGEDFDLGDYGLDFGNFDIEILEPEETEGDDDVPESAPPITVLGDLYELGGVHRVMCGDSLSSDAVERLMDGQKAVLAHNDPPYGMKKEKEGIQNDNLNYDDLLEFNSQWIPLQFSYLEDNGSFYCWGIDEPLMDIYSHILKPLIKTQRATFRNLITWHKDPSGLGDGQNNSLLRSYGIIDEKCLFVMCGVQGFNNNADNYFEGWENIRLYLVQEKEKLGLSNKELTKYLNSFHTHYWTTSQWAFPTSEHYEKLQDYCKTNNIDAFKKEYDELKKEYDEIKKEYYSTRAYFNNTHDNMTNVWDIARTKGKEREQTGGHATPKPLELCDRVIKSSSPEGAIVTDWFLGSGSTLISCEKLGRKCYGMELDQKYCDVIVKRYVTFCKSNNKPYSVFRNGKVCKDFE